MRISGVSGLASGLASGLGVSATDLLGPIGMLIGGPGEATDPNYATNLTAVGGNTGDGTTSPSWSGLSTTEWVLIGCGGVVILALVLSGRGRR